MSDKKQKWTLASIKRKLMACKRGENKVTSAVNVGWTGYQNVTLACGFDLKRKEETKHNDYTWYVNDEPVLLKNSDQHYYLSDLLWRMHNWD